MCRSAVVLLRMAEALNQDRATAAVRMRTEGVSEAGGAGIDSGARWGGAGAVVAEERGGLFPRGLSARALD